MGKTTGAAAGERRIRGLTSAERKQVRRRQLLDAALDQFATRGYAAVTVDQVCQAAYVSTKSFYADYQNKEELFLDLYGDLLDQAAAKVAVATEDPRLDETERSRRRIAAFVHACVDDPRVARIAFLEAAGLSPAVEERRRQAHHFFARVIEASTMPKVAQGVLPKRNYHRAALGMVGAVNEVLVDWVLDPDPDPIEVLIDQVTEVFLLVRDGLEILLHEQESRPGTEGSRPRRRPPAGGDASR